MKRIVLAFMIALVAFLTAGTASALETSGAPALSEERIVLRTVAGDLVLVLYPELAPKTVEQMLKLARAGVLDTTAFVRVHPGFVAQLSAHHDRTVPLDDNQKALIKKLPAEFTSFKHVRGTLSMAREEADVNGAETSFSILLGPAPHLDGKYTVFGRLESGEAVLEEMVRVPRDPSYRPLVRLEVTRADVVPGSGLAGASVAPARAVTIPAEVAAAAESAAAYDAASSTLSSSAGEGEGEMARRDVGPAVAWCLGLMCLIGIVSFFLQGKVPASVHGSLNLLMVLVGAFVLIIVLMPKGQRSPWLATALFFGLIGVFKLLGKFESPAQK